ncbi:chromosome transmission fidelity protein 8, partial [Calycina marina]
RNPLPTLLHTTAGLAIIELQGTINLPSENDVDAIATEGRPRETPVGRLVFPNYVQGTDSQSWMKRVYMYVGKHQRLTGEVKKLPRAIAVIRKRTHGVEMKDAGNGETEELEIVEIVKYKILFATRPEPVGAMV